MEFNRMEYKRPDFIQFRNEVNRLLSVIQKSLSWDEVQAAIHEVNKQRSSFETMSALAELRYYANLKDEFYRLEQEYFQSLEPQYEGEIAGFYQKLLSSPWRSRVEEKWGKQFFTLAEQKVKTYSDETAEDLAEENRLIAQYRSLINELKAVFKGDELRIGQLFPYLMSQDRNTRKEAYQARYDAMGSIEESIDQVFDKLVKVRTKIARKLGYHNFVELGYARLKRSDYDAGRVKVFRELVSSKLVPFIQEILKKQAERLGVEKLKYYDEKTFFPSGDPVLKTSQVKELVKAVKVMFEEMSPETGEYFQFMIENKLMDLEGRENKSAGSFIHYIRDFKSPFIFANLNGVSDDVRLFIHESGHGFQFYLSRFLEIPEYLSGTFEVTEIPSMTMELLTEPWNERFFGADAEKYGFMQVMGGFQNIPYITAIDEFQHIVYEKPELTPEQRKSAWKSLEEKYLPLRDYDGLPYLKGGTFWQQQSHLFIWPFYYIDYAFAICCAHQFWKAAKENHKAAWANFLNLCRLGGSVPFLTLLKEAGIPSPFDPECLQEMIKSVRSWLAEWEQPLQKVD